MKAIGKIIPEERQRGALTSSSSTTFHLSRLHYPLSLPPLRRVLMKRACALFHIPAMAMAMGNGLIFAYLRSKLHKQQTLECLLSAWVSHNLHPIPTSSLCGL
eukprot:scaffold166833_cov34-Tisochrysis_lutea.AAC.2